MQFSSFKLNHFLKTQNTLPGSTIPFTLQEKVSDALFSV
jgi:hypothetical protein